MKKFLTLISAAMLLNSFAAPAKKQVKSVPKARAKKQTETQATTFSLLFRNAPSMGMKISGYDPALVHAGQEFTRIMRAVTGFSNYNNGGYYQLIMALAGNESSPDAEKAIKANNLSREKLGDDGFVLHFLGGRKFVLTAYTGRGILNGVYKIFQKNLDVVFTRPSADLVFPPRKLTAVAIKVPYIDKPAFSMRGFSVTSSVWLYDNPGMYNYMSRNCANMPGASPASLEATAGIRSKYGFLQKAGGHTFHYWLPASIYAKDHPEYFGVDKEGKPNKKFYHGGQIALGHPEVTDIIVKRMIAYKKKHPTIEYLAFGYNDTDGQGIGFGDDKWSVKLDSPNDYPKKGSKRYRTYSTRYIKAANEIISRVNKVYPDLKMHVYAYHWWMMQAPDCEVHPNLLVEFAPLYKCTIHSIGDDNCLRNSLFKEHLTNWSKKTKNIYFRDYFGSSGRYPLFPLQIVQNELKFYKSLGINGAAPETRPDGPDGANLQGNVRMPRWLKPDVPTYSTYWDANALMHFVFLQLLWDPEQKLEDLVHQYCRNYYGDAVGKLMAAYHLEVSKRFYNSGNPGKTVPRKSDFIDNTPWCFCWNWEKHIGDYAGRLVDRKLPAKQRRESATKLLKLISNARAAAGKTENAIVRTRVEKDFELFRVYMLSLGYEISNMRGDRFVRSWMEEINYEK